MEQLIQRDLEEKINKFMHRKEIFGIRGPRQAGKTTLMNMIYAKLKGKKKFVNLENVLIREELEKDPISFIKRYNLDVGGYLFLDEVQLLRDGGSILKLLYDTYESKLKIFFSGSSTLEIKTNILPKLVGRLWLFDLYPLSFGEFLRAKDKGLYKLHKNYRDQVMDFIEGNESTMEEPLFSQDFLKLWEEYVLYGGYPEVVKTEDLEEKKEILMNIVSLQVEKDVTGYFNIRDYAKFTDFLRFLATSISSPISLNSLSSLLSKNYHVVDEYLNASMHSYLISILKPYYGKSIATEIKKSPKIYFIDLGIRNAILKNFSPLNTRTDVGNLLENYIFLELLKLERYELNYWRNKSKNEIDFLIRTPTQIKAIAECKFSFSKIPRIMYAFMDKYEVKRSIIFNFDKFDYMRKNDKEFFVLPAFYL